MRKELLLLLSIFFWVSLAYLIGLNPNLLLFLTKYAQISTCDASLLFVILMVVFSIISAWKLIYVIKNSLKDYSKDF